MVFRSRRRRRHGRNFFFGSFYLNLGAQYTFTIAAAIVCAALVFIGMLTFRNTDESDLLARGRRLMAESKPKAAMDVLETLVSRYQNSYEGHIELGKVYLELDDPKKAKQQFSMAAAIRANHPDRSAAEIAKSKLYIAQKNFEEGASQLQASFKKNPDDAELREALFEVYQQWGMDLADNQKDYPEAIRKYRLALGYANDYELEDGLKTRMIEAMTVYARQLERDKKFDEALEVIESSLRYRYDSNTLLQVAEMYERNNNIDKAIIWYRKAFDANPEEISIKLSDMLIRKGKQLLADNKTEAAEGFFDEADRIIRSANISPDKLYPVEISYLKITPKIDYETGMLSTTVDVKFLNKSHRPLEFMSARVEFVSGDAVVSEDVKVVATPEDPMPREIPSKDKNKPSQGERGVTFKPDSINIHALNGNVLRVKVSIAYSQGSNPDWHTKGLQEIKIEGKISPAPGGEPA